jgi:hypothetical protein
VKKTGEKVKNEGKLPKKNKKKLRIGLPLRFLSAKKVVLH